ncbi:MAG: hypothetical protein IH612_08175 [Desulfofustis sp.]|nr:hypothetical protein [Desulfofustis sp.]
MPALSLFTVATSNRREKHSANRRRHIEHAEPEMKQYHATKTLLLSGIGSALLAVAVSLLPAETGAALVREHGPVESATAFFYLLAALWLVYRSFQEQRGWNLTAAGLVVLLLLRELDFHARFTTMGVLKSRYYLSPDVPAGEKTVVSVLMILILVVAGRFVWRNLPLFIHGLRHRQAAPLAVAAAIGMAVISKMLDSLSRPIRHLLEPLYHGSKTYLRVYEEVFEMTIPLFILLAISFAVTNRRQSANHAGSGTSRPPG